MDGRRHHLRSPSALNVMAWKCIQRGPDQITIEADPAVELAGGKLKGLYLCRARSLTAHYVRKGAEGETVLVSATSPEQAMLKLERAIESGAMISRPAGQAARVGWTQSAAESSRVTSNTTDGVIVRRPRRPGRDPRNRASDVVE